MNLEEVPFFRNLPQETLENIRPYLKEVYFQKKEVISHEKDLCRNIFFVKKGRIKLYRLSTGGREQILQVLEEGDTCACNPGTNNWHCGATAEALTAATVWLLKREHYIEITKKYSQFYQTLNETLANRICLLNNLVEEISLTDTKSRLIKFLLNILENQAQSNQISITIPFTREEIAQRLGTSRETISRHLQSLKQAALISIQPHQITILDKHALEELIQ